MNNHPYSYWKAVEYCQAKVRTPLPSEYLSPWHLSALADVGFDAQLTDKGTILVTKHDVNFQVDDYYESRVPRTLGSVEEFLETTELTEYADLPFVKNLIALHYGSHQTTWEGVIQLVLRDLPEDVRHIDVTSATWSDNAELGFFEGSATRITRNSIHSLDSAGKFFAMLDEATRRHDQAAAQGMDARIAGVVGDVVGYGEISLGQALRSYFPEAVEGDVTPDADYRLTQGVTSYVEAWVRGNVPDENPDAKLDREIQAVLSPYFDRLCAALDIEGDRVKADEGLRLGASNMDLEIHVQPADAENTYGISFHYSDMPLDTMIISGKAMIDGPEFDAHVDDVRRIIESVHSPRPGL